MIPSKKIQKSTLLALFLVSIFLNNTTAQTTVIPNQDSRVITTGVPFLLIASDARAAGMGDMGVATSDWIGTFNLDKSITKFDKLFAL